MMIALHRTRVCVCVCGGGGGVPAQEKISAFLRAARAFGVPEFDLFSTDDLFDGKDLLQVALCVHSLGRIVPTANVSGAARGQVCAGARATDA